MYEIFLDLSQQIKIDFLFSVSKVLINAYCAW